MYWRFSLEEVKIKCGGGALQELQKILLAIPGPQTLMV